MNVEYVANPDLKFIKEGIQGNLKIDGQYVNGQSKDDNKLKDVLKWKFAYSNPHKEEKKNENYRLPVQADTRLLHSNKNGIQWLGHATFLMRIEGKLCITDPIFGSLPLLKRQSDFPIDPEKIERIDYVFISHAHRDHLDIASLKILFKNNPKAIALAPLEVGSLLRKAGAKNIQEAAWWQRFETNHLEVSFLPSKHWHRRGLFDFNRMLWGSFMIRSKNHTIYFAGDSAMDVHFEEISKSFQKIDFALLPVGAYKPNFMMKDSHLSPEEAVSAFNQLDANFFIPCHYGTFDLSDEPMSEPEQRLNQQAAAGKINGQLILPKIGEIVDLKPLLKENNASSSREETN